MGLQHFIQVERQHPEGSQIHLFHHANPKFSLEIQPFRDSDGRIIGGVIKRIRLKNSWTRDYHQYSKLISQAEKVFRRSLAASPENRLPDRRP